MKLLVAAKAFYARLSKRERWILYGAFFFLGTLFTDRLVLRPVFDKMSRLEDDVKNEEAAIKKSLHVLLRKEQIVADGKRLERYTTASDLPDDKQITALMKELEGMANKAAVSLVYVKPGNVEPGKGMKRFLASLECEAEMREIVSFFHDLENSTKLFRIEKYEIQQKSKDSNTARCTMVVSRTLISG